MTLHLFAGSMISSHSAFRSLIGDLGGVTESPQSMKGEGHYENRELGEQLIEALLE